MTTLGKLIAGCVIVLVAAVFWFTLMQSPPKSIQDRTGHRHPDWDWTLDLELLERVKLSDDESRLAYLRKYSASDEDLLGVERLIRQLGSLNFKERQSAEDRLIRLNLVALPHLRKAKSDKDLEIATRAAKCVTAIEENTRLSVPLSVVRVLLDRVPEGTVPALLRYLPFAQDEEVEQEIAFGLYELSKETGKLDPALIAALADRLRERRALAACIVGRLGNKEQRAKVHRLLEDASPLVSLRAAQGLLAAEDAAGIPALIELLSEPAVEISWQAEELLHWVAGDQSPQQTVGAASQEERRACRKAWEGWWGKHGPRVDLAEAYRSSRRPLLILVCEGDDPGEPSALRRVALYGSNGDARWEFKGAKQPVDVQLLHDNRLLVVDEAERGVPTFTEKGPPRPPVHAPDTVTEQRLDGTVLWTYKARISRCRRLANGNTVAYGAGGMSELTPEGKNVSSVQSGFMSADQMSKYFARAERRLGNARVLGCSLSERSPEILEFDPVKGVIVRRVKLARSAREVVDVLRTGQLLARGETRLAALDWTGEEFWSCRIKEVTTIAPLLEGNLLAGEASSGQRIYELTQEGRTVWETFPRGAPERIRICLPLIRLGFDQRPRGEIKRSAATLAAALKSKQVGQRRRAAFLLRGSPAEALELVPMLVGGLGDEDVQVRRGCYMVLEQMGVRASGGLIQGLEHDQAEVRALACELLAGLREKGRSSYPSLIRASRDRNPLVRKESLLALGHVGAPADRILPVLLSALKDEDKAVCQSAALVLSRLGKEAKPVLTALVEMSRSRSIRERELALLALGGVGAHFEDAASALVDALPRAENKPIRRSIVGSIGEAGYRGKRAVPLLVRLLEDEKGKADDGTEDLVSIVAWTLGRIGREATGAVPALGAVLLNKRFRFSVRYNAADSLGLIGQPSEQIARFLNEARKDEDQRVSETAARVLERLKQNPRKR